MNFVAFFPAIAEIWLAVGALMLVLGGVFSKPEVWKGWTVFAILAIVASLIVATRHYEGAHSAFDSMFMQDNLALSFKYLIGTGSILAIILAVPYFARRNDGKFEYPLLILLATVGMFGMVSSQDFLALYVSLELQSLSLYVLASFRRDQRLNAEAGLKYFFLGALSSGLLLYGISLLYGYTGSTNYLTIGNTLAQGQITPAQIVALVLTLSGLAFKISAAPFHMWTPDVYQGAPTPVTALFAMAPKAAAIGALCRLVTGPLAPVFEQVQQVLIALSVLSLAVGAFAAIAQKNVKRLMAYSSIGHMGFVLMALAVGGSEAMRAAWFYAALYIIMSACAFAVILAVYDDAEGSEDLGHLAGLAKRSPVLAFAFAATLLSMAGIPPFAGFLAKFYVFRAALEAGLVPLVVFGVIASVVSAYYYLRLIKIMYFDEAKKGAPALVVSKTWVAVAFMTAIALIVLLIYPVPLGDLAQWAVAGQ
jgi:NADH-quinone oxidoreductase subunit N